jgi:hydrogenase-4 component F
VRGLVARHPAVATTFGFGVLALIGLPPFSLFASELGIARAGFTAGLGWFTAAALLLVLVIAAALISRTSRMLLGSPSTSDRTTVSPIPIALTGGLLACAVLGIVAGPLPVLLDLATQPLAVTR